MFEIKNATCGYGQTEILKNINLSLDEGNILCLLGPNGIGKTTLFKSMLGFLPLLGGEILIDGENVKDWPAHKLAQVVGYVPQEHTPPFPFSVLDVVTMGRVAYLGIFASPGEEDERVAMESIERLEIPYLADRTYTEISGGERQMVLIARSLAQNPRYLIMDEPTANLDFSNQTKVLRQVNRLAKSGMAIIMTTHFPDHTFLCDSTVCLLERNRDMLIGPADEVVTEENLKRAYGIDVKIISEEVEGVGTLKSCIPIIND